MSSRMENGDLWATPRIQAADRGPGGALRPRSSGRGRTVMSESGARADGTRGPRRPSEGTGWAVVSYLIGGMVLYGGIGWLIGRWMHIAVLFPVGMLLGMGLALALVILRFTRS